ncbi:MAG: hypothetical protein Q9164_007200 [Protoblastenia rupestris]
MRTQKAEIKSPLVALPPEIQSTIVRYLVQLRDLNSLSRTCHTLKTIVNPSLYDHIELKVPLYGGRLPSLEHLVSLAPTALAFCHSLSIVQQQAPPPACQSGPYRDLTDSDSEDDHYCDSFKYHELSEWASSSSNTLVRLLIAMLPKNTLHSFCWEHDSLLDSPVVDLLFKSQGATLSNLRTRRSSSFYDPPTGSRAPRAHGLEEFSAAHLNQDENKWLLRLLANSYATIRRLCLGTEYTLFVDYARGGILDKVPDYRVRNSHAILNLITCNFEGANGGHIPRLELDELRLCGLNLCSLADASFRPMIDFSRLSVLKIESCVGWSDAFPLLLGRGTTGIRRETTGCLKLRTFIMRAETLRDGFLDDLEDFLTSIPPLNKLHVLIEGSVGAGIPANIAKHHGQSLQSLVWDERPRPTSHIERSNFHTAEHLKHISKHCVNLKALGISLTWHFIIRDSKICPEVSIPSPLCEICLPGQSISHIVRLSKLEMLNIRNVPCATSAVSLLSNDFTYSALATSFLEKYTTERPTARSARLKTLALGATTYGNSYMGMYYFPDLDFADFFRLRIYNVEYLHHRTTDTWSPKPRLVAKGVPNDAIGYSKHLDVFEPYWLDAEPRKAT